MAGLAGSLARRIEMDSIAIISDEMRIVIESERPELVHKLPPRK